MTRRVLLIGYPAWDTSRQDPNQTPERAPSSPVSAAARILSQAAHNIARARRADIHARLRTETSGL